jgi:hypothetical protein
VRPVQLSLSSRKSVLFANQNVKIELKLTLELFYYIMDDFQPILSMEINQATNKNLDLIDLRDMIKK